MSLFAYEKAASYLRNMEHWEIEKQNEALLGHNTIVLAGKMADEVNNSENLKGSTEAFRFGWIKILAFSLKVKHMTKTVS